MAEFKLIKVNTIVVHVKKMERSIDFYKNTLRLTEDFVEDGMAYFSIGSGDEKNTIMLHITDQPEPVEKGVIFEYWPMMRQQLFSPSKALAVKSSRNRLTGNGVSKKLSSPTRMTTGSGLSSPCHKRRCSH